MTRTARSTTESLLVASFLVVGVVLCTSGQSACLEALPAPAKCSADFAALSYCAPNPPIPPTTNNNCTLLGNECLRESYAGCVCNESNGCPKTADRCFPAPDCPTSVRSAFVGVRCLEPNISLSTTTPVGPAQTRPDAGPGVPPLPPATGGPPCSCGCINCTEVCDGKGPVIGPNQTLTVVSNDLPPSGGLGFMIRARGRGQLTMQLFGALGVTLPAVDGGYLVSRDPQGTSTFTDMRGAPPFVLGEGPRRIERVELTTSDDAAIEIDCIVPYVVPPAR